MKRVCFLLGGLTGGGIGRVTSIISNELSKDANYKIHLISYFKTGKPPIYQVNDKINKSFLFDSPISMTRGILPGIIKLRKYLKGNDIDVLIACGALYFPLSVLSCIGIKTKCICWEHSNVQNNKDHSFQNFCRLVGSKISNHVVTLTKFDKNSYLKNFKTKNITHIYNPIDAKVYKHVSKYNTNSKKIISVGRISYAKNFELLVDVAKKVLDVHTDWQWDIYGDGDLKSVVQKKIDTNKLNDRLFLRGNVNNLYSSYNNYSMLVMTSRYEGFPMTLLEGMANKLPLISFDVNTGPNEIIEHGTNGYLIKPFDEQEMVNSIIELINNRDLRNLMSESNEKLSDKFTIEDIIGQWKCLIQKL